MKKLTELEICKRIAELEGFVEHRINFDEDPKNQFEVKVNFHYWDQYNPLTDDALCFHLMIKYDVEMQITSERDKHDKSRGKYPKQYYASIKADEAMSVSPNKAICLAIIKAHKESNKTIEQIQQLDT